jgi:hypothetical protein
MNSGPVNVLFGQDKSSRQKSIERNRIGFAQQVTRISHDSGVSLVGALFVARNGRMNYGRVIGKIKSHFANSFSKFLDRLDQKLGHKLSSHEHDDTAKDGGCRGPQDFFKVILVPDA